MRSIICQAMAAITCAVQLAAADSAPPSSEQEVAAREWTASFAESRRLYSAGRFADAERLMADAVRYAGQLSPFDDRLPLTMHTLGFLYQEQGKVAEAKSCYLRAIHLWERLGPGKQPEALSKTIDNLIGVYMESRDYPEAEKLMRSRLEEMESSSTWAERANFLNMQAALAFRQRRYLEVEHAYHESLRLWQEHSKTGDRDTAIVELNLSTLYEVTNRYHDALDAGMRALTILERPDPTFRPFLARALENAAFVLAKLNRLTEADRLYRRALVEAEDVFGPDHPISGRIMRSYSAVLRRLQRTLEAKQLAGQARAILGQPRQTDATVDILELRRSVR